MRCKNFFSKFHTRSKQVVIKKRKEKRIDYKMLVNIKGSQPIDLKIP